MNKMKSLSLLLLFTTITIHTIACNCADSVSIKDILPMDSVDNKALFEGRIESIVILGESDFSIITAQPFKSWVGLGKEAVTFSFISQVDSSECALGFVIGDTVVIHASNKAFMNGSMPYADICSGSLTKNHAMQKGYYAALDTLAYIEHKAKVDVYAVEEQIEEDSKVPNLPSGTMPLIILIIVIIIPTLLLILSKWLYK